MACITLMLPEGSSVTKTYRAALYLLWLFLWSCAPASEKAPEAAEEPESHVVVKKRDDGSLSSINQVDELNRVHGLRVTYYADGKTVYSKTTFEHGIKHGPFVRYYRSGQVFEQTSFRNGERDGITRKYYMNGDLMAEFSSDNGLDLPGLKEYARDGSLITDYPEIRFREIDHLKGRSRIDLEIFCEQKGYPVKYYRTVPGTEHKERVYLISERGKTSLQFYLQPGEKLEEEVEVTAEIPTELGNTLVRYLSYSLNAQH
jgi:hypothetical protein